MPRGGGSKVNHSSSSKAAGANKKPAPDPLPPSKYEVPVSTHRFSNVTLTGEVAHSHYKTLAQQFIRKMYASLKDPKLEELDKEEKKKLMSRIEASSRLAEGWAASESGMSHHAVTDIDGNAAALMILKQTEGGRKISDLTSDPGFRPKFPGEKKPGARLIDHAKEVVNGDTLALNASSGNSNPQSLIDYYKDQGFRHKKKSGPSEMIWHRDPERLAELAVGAAPEPIASGSSPAALPLNEASESQEESKSEADFPQPSPTRSSRTPIQLKRKGVTSNFGTQPRPRAAFKAKRPMKEKVAKWVAADRAERARFLENEQAHIAEKPASPNIFKEKIKAAFPGKRQLSHDEVKTILPSRLRKDTLFLKMLSLDDADKPIKGTTDPQTHSNKIKETMAAWYFIKREQQREARSSITPEVSRPRKEGAHDFDVHSLNGKKAGIDVFQTPIHGSYYNENAKTDNTKIPKNHEVERFLNDSFQNHAVVKEFRGVMDLTYTNKSSEEELDRKIKNRKFRGKNYEKVRVPIDRYYREDEDPASFGKHRGTLPP